MEEEESEKKVKEILAIPAKAPKRVKQLGEQQIAYIKALYDKHGDNCKSMARDMKLNYLQLTSTQCKNNLGLFLNPSPNLRYEFRDSDM